MGARISTESILNLEMNERQQISEKGHDKCGWYVIAYQYHFMDVDFLLLLLSLRQECEVVVVWGEASFF